MYLEKPQNSSSTRQPSRLPVELFKTGEEYYIFDVNRVVFLEVNEVIFDVVSILKNTLKDFRELVEELPRYSAPEIRDALSEIADIQRQGYLKPSDFQWVKPYTLAEIKKNLSGNLSGLYLNVTSKCNLSCSYCIFGGDYEHQGSLQQREMSWDTARKAIDFFLSRASRKGTLRVDFFGGEPVLSFPLIKRIVENIKEKIRPRNQELFISISSNGTVMTDKIIDFLIEHDVHFQISVDGEKEVQDAKRKFKNSSVGSFDTVIKSLQKIFDRDPGYYKNRVRLKAVITTQSLDSDGKNFFNIPLIKLLDDQKQFTMLNQSPHYNLEKDEDFFSRIHILGKSLLEKKNAANIEELLDGLSYTRKYLFYVTFYEFFQIQVVNYLRFENKPAPYSKNCMIGIEGCVNVDGSISICYKAGTFIIGDVLKDTWYFDKIAEFNEKRYHHRPKCRRCFVQRFCSLCYEKIDGKEGQFKASIKNYCEFNRYYFRVIFEYMLKIMEKNPALWDEPQRMAEKEKEYLKRKYAEEQRVEKN